MRGRGDGQPRVPLRGESRASGERGARRSLYELVPCARAALLLRTRITITVDMRGLTACVVLLVALALASARPQREGAAFTKEAIKQAQSTFLIPKDAEIQKVRVRSRRRPA
ncbi:hypothetical protein EVAR_21070_1 [Eumeta japonica]|uniref:Uncharacterized protein n=1 Tax=Eumeta variegata TaxID=151549 RepID=A0A4C1V170_EUMVA|nr:hypothetical protein EVAR_21070_1 [Eumeta japonica]